MLLSYNNNLQTTKCTWNHHVLLLYFRCGFKSTTITVMLSLLPFWSARFDRNSAAACAAGSIPSPLSEGSSKPFFLYQRSIRFRARSHTSSFVITSHRPSLARMRHSSSFARGRNRTSGSGIIHGFKYLSPEVTDARVSRNSLSRIKQLHNYCRTPSCTDKQAGHHHFTWEKNCRTKTMPLLCIIHPNLRIKLKYLVLFRALVHLRPKFQYCPAITSKRCWNH